jgi:hypothetical protein
MMYELLRQAYAIIDGIPDDRFNLVRSCGTIACAGGWLCMHPTFIALGLRAMFGSNGAPEFVDEQTGDYTVAFAALGKALGLTFEQAFQLFTCRGDAYFDRHNDIYSLSDKQLWQARVRHFLNTQGDGCEFHPGDEAVPADR